MIRPTVRRLPPVAPTWEHSADVVVIGAGAAGLSAALAASAGGRDAVLLCKGHLGSGATAWAQGGLAAAVDPIDSPDLHVRDTALAGAGLCDAAAVHALAAAAPAEIARLAARGASFDCAGRGAFSAAVPGARLALTREGGHSRDRIVHAGGDASGAEVDRVLRAALAASRVRVLEHVVALDVLLDTMGAAAGVAAATVGTGGRLDGGVILAAAVIVAAGGGGQAWGATTNPPGATGDGLALALRAGAELRDVEFVQFHPTVLYQGPASVGQQLLISEAVRGEGAVLVDATGVRVMSRHDARGDLAPRDVVAAAIHDRMRQAPGGVDDHVYLDATGLGRSLLERRFPTVVAGCRSSGIDPVTELIPVAPGAHYFCGGVRSDLFGRTSVPGLLAVGEAAATGVHGANRLGSNSLPEALLTGRLAGELLASALPPRRTPVAVAAGPGVAPETRVTTAAGTSHAAGVVRSGDGLARLLDQLATVPGAATGRSGPCLDMVEATALHTVSTLVATAALERQESRGCHRRSDFPAARHEWLRHLTWRLDGEELSSRTAPRDAAA